MVAQTLNSKTVLMKMVQLAEFRSLDGVGFFANILNTNSIDPCGLYPWGVED